MLDAAISRILYAKADRDVLRPWVWPLPKLNGCRPSRLREADDFVELGYHKLVDEPRFLPVLAAHDGLIIYAGRSGDHHAICLDHAGGWSTQYGNLEHVFPIPTDRFRRRRKERVRAGDVLGYVGGSQNALRFTLAQLDDEQDALVAIDPTARMERWLLLPWTNTNQIAG